MNKAIYALSADPITLGHVNIIKRASEMFDKLYVAIGDNPEKQYLFSNNSRVNLAKKSLANFKNVEVVSFEGLLVDFAMKKGIKTIVRGIRNSIDMEYEKKLNILNKGIYDEIETIFLFSDPNLDHVSSSTVKNLMKDNVDISNLVPPIVKTHLEKRIKNQVFIGVTGLMGCGKSYTANKLVEISKNNQTPFHNIELDDIAKDILYNPDFEDHFSHIRNKLIDIFGTKDKSQIAKIFFDSKENMKKLEKLLFPYLMSEIRRRTCDLEGVILINSATLVESNMLKNVSNKVILITTEEQFRQHNLESKRNVSKEEADKRMSHLLNLKDKRNTILDSITESNHGFIIEFNAKNSSNDDKIKELYHTIELSNFD